MMKDMKKEVSNYLLLVSQCIEGQFLIILLSYLHSFLPNAYFAVCDNFLHFKSIFEKHFIMALNNIIASNITQQLKRLTFG